MNTSFTIAGLDIGSRQIKLCLLRDGIPVFRKTIPTTFDPLNQCIQLLKDLSPGRIIATGYGRSLFAREYRECEVSTLTEIQAHALGAFYLDSSVRTVLDIGGQDTKVIALGNNGKVRKFEMNDRCAAGTGKFLEIMATSLQVPLEDFGEFALSATGTVKISSMCAVFAESEIVSLVARGENAKNIARGIHQSIVERTQAMLSRIDAGYPLMFVGGVAYNPCVRHLLEKQLNSAVLVPEAPEMTGALGAALSGYKKPVASLVVSRENAQIAEEFVEFLETEKIPLNKQTN